MNNTRSKNKLFRIVLSYNKWKFGMSSSSVYICKAMSDILGKHDIQFIRTNLSLYFPKRRRETVKEFHNRVAWDMKLKKYSRGVIVKYIISYRKGTIAFDIFLKSNSSVSDTEIATIISEWYDSIKFGTSHEWVVVTALKKDAHKTSFEHWEEGCPKMKRNTNSEYSHRDLHGFYRYDD